MTTHGAVAANADVKAKIPSLAELASHIGDEAVRHRGTIGGSLANNDPAADYPAAALALGATIKTDKRSITADDFFQGMFTTALEQGELITSVEFPAPEKGAYEKFRNPASRYAIVGVYVAKTAGGVRVAVTGAGQNGVFRHTAMEQALSANFSPDAIAEHRHAGGRAEQRHPRQRRVSRPSGGRDGEARGRTGVLKAHAGDRRQRRSSARSGHRSQRVLASLVLEARGEARVEDAGPRDRDAPAGAGGDAWYQLPGVHARDHGARRVSVAWAPIPARSERMRATLVRHG